MRDLTAGERTLGWELVRGAGVVGWDLGDELEAVGDVEGPPGLVAVGASRVYVAGSATVGAQATVVPTLALL